MLHSSTIMRNICRCDPTVTSALGVQLVVTAPWNGLLDGSQRLDFGVQRCSVQSLYCVSEIDSAWPFIQSKTAR